MQKAAIFFLWMPGTGLWLSDYSPLNSIHSQRIN